MKNQGAHIVLVGCGKMGSALLRSWISNKSGASYAVIEPHPLPENLPDIVHHAKNAGDLSDEIKNADIVVLAVKPQIMAAACRSVRGHLSVTTPVLSIAAGQTLAGLEACFEPGQPVIRCMPNTPAAIGQGITVAVANSAVNEAQRALASALLKTTGALEWTDDESLLNAVTAVSGSGPAYVFYLIEVLTAAGIDSGLPAALAEKLARQTVIGAGALAAHDAGTPAAQLRQNVTSPGGTTEAALRILMNGELETLFKKAIAAAKHRGEELNS